ncbi:putative inorganic phosphate cotransporter [Phymastichus coffea]|uniref:putative inorganic phosphate cotransporter n=1 Tax=Phymastichus coffea TaxID=108790 RepID=UPI00273CB574|nr:putative inorganic phosphate cotransporter [Phymastichus coffea]
MLPTWIGCRGTLQQRWVFAVMGFFGLFNAYALRICLSIAITEMVVPLNITEELIDDTCSNLVVQPANVSTPIASNGATYKWSEYTQGIILSSFYWGYVITHLPGGLLAEKFGGKHTLGLGILLTAIFTGMVPIAVQWADSTALIILRVLMGFSGGVIFPALNVMMAHWVPPQELSLITAVIFIGVDFGVIGATTISGLILRYSSVGWPGVFYFFGGIGILWFVLWALLCYNDPDEHPFISDKEKTYLRESLHELTHKDSPAVPWLHIFRSRCFWALLAVQIGHDWGLYTLVTDLPKYMSSVLRFSVEYNGYLSSLPNLCSVFYCLFISWITDKMITLDYVSRTNARKINTTISTIIPGLLIIGASYAGCDRVAVVIMFTLGVTFMGSSLPGIKVNSLDLSPNYAGTVMALTNGIASFTGIMTPYLVGVLTPNQTLSEWRLVFWIVFLVFFVTNTIFVSFASGDVQDWNDPKFLKDEYDKKMNTKL